MLQRLTQRRALDKTSHQHKRPAGDFPIQSSTIYRLRAAAIVFSTAFLLIGCFGANFISFDDSAHIANVEYANAKSNWEYFIPKVNTTYLPITFLSYKADRWLHEWWSMKLFNSWAPCVRLDTLLIHATAALFLWRLLARLRMSENRSFFIAMIFACHPLACETVCWVSERKNTLSALFGFAALWTQSLAFGKPAEVLEMPRQHSAAGGAWRLPVVCILFALALMGKPSALGLLPILLLIESAVLFPANRNRLFGKDSSDSGPMTEGRWISYAGMIALTAIALGCLKVNLFTHSEDMVPPPGGSVFTALLTDLDIFSRYIFNLICPVGLSSMYFVEPVLGLSDPRVWLYGAFIAAVIGGTIYFGRSRWVAAFGWFWFFSALATNANVIAIPHWMQDRYTYLATPGFFIAVSEFIAGLSRQYSDERQRRKLAMAFGVVVACAFMAISASRSFVWASTLKMSLDATRKQPKSFFAHYTLACALYPPASHTTPGTPEYEMFQREWKRQLLIAVNECPDADRFTFKQGAASDLGKEAYAANDAAGAEKYFNIAITKSPIAPDFADAHGVSLAYLSMLDLYHKRDPEIALEKAKEAFRLVPVDQSRFALGSAYLACAQRNPHAKGALLAEARKVLSDITKGTPMREDADALINEIDKSAVENPSSNKPVENKPAGK